MPLFTSSNAGNEKRLAGEIAAPAAKRVRTAKPNDSLLPHSPSKSLLDTPSDSQRNKENTPLDSEHASYAAFWARRDFGQQQAREETAAISRRQSQRSSTVDNEVIKSNSLSQSHKLSTTASVPSGLPRATSISTAPVTPSWNLDDALKTAGQIPSHAKLPRLVWESSREDEVANSHMRPQSPQWKEPVVVKPIENTPSDKPYKYYCHNGQSFIVPDGWRKQAKDTSKYDCPVRECPAVYKMLTLLGNHFDAAHARDMFNDNCDGTLTVVGKANKDDSDFKFCVISQNPVDKSDSSSERPPLPGEEREKPEVGQSNASANTVPPSGARRRSEAQSHLDISNAAKISDPSGSTPMPNAWQPPHSMEATQDITAALELAFATSATWKTLEFCVTTLGGKKIWLTAYKGVLDFERRAFLQLISLLPKNNIDREWLKGITNSHQQSFKGLICVLVAIVGVKGPCQACQRRAPEKTRHCAALPPQAKDMMELQKLVGTTCSECYHFPTKSNCGFPFASEAPIGIKQTPVVAPLPDRSATSQTVQLPKGISPLPTLPAQAVSKNSAPSLRPISKTPIQPADLSSVSVSSSQVTSQLQDVFDQRKPPNTDDASRVEHKAISTDMEDIARKASRPRSARMLPRSADDEGDCSSAHTSSVFSTAEESIINDSRATSTSIVFRPSSGSIVSKALGLLTEVSQLANEEQSGVYTKIVEMVEVIRRPILDLAADRMPGTSTPLTEEWETAPGRLTFPIAGTGRQSLIAFSTSYLRREVVDVELATQISRGQRVLNRHIPALHQVMVEKFDARWDCSLTVLDGVVQVKLGPVEAKIGQGGIFVISQDAACFITNVTHRDCPVQIRWVEK